MKGSPTATVREGLLAQRPTPTAMAEAATIRACFLLSCSRPSVLSPHSDSINPRSYSKVVTLGTGTDKFDDGTATLLFKARRGAAAWRAQLHTRARVTRTQTHMHAVRWLHLAPPLKLSA